MFPVKTNNQPHAGLPSGTGPALKIQPVVDKYRSWLWTMFVLFATTATILAQAQILPENPLKGRLVFEQKGCSSCHAINGIGKQVGPDLGAEKFHGSALDLAGVMWNHLPKMLLQIKELELPFPEFTNVEFNDLLAYLYYLPYLGKPGDLYKGKQVFESKGCRKCHSIAGLGGNLGPAFDTYGKYVSPLFLAQALWNHGPEMETQLRQAGIALPKFSGSELDDLNAYIRAAGKQSADARLFMSPGNPKRGKTIFTSKGCTFCHQAAGDRRGPDLSRREWGYSVSEIAGVMLNHSYSMYARMQVENQEWPQFQGNELADVIAYLFFLGFEDKPGDHARGRSVFQSKGCINCHQLETAQGQQVRSLIGTTPLTSSVDMARIMWNHAPIMEKQASMKVLTWPVLTGEEMVDLYAFILTLQKFDR